MGSIRDFVLNELTNKKIAKATHEGFTVEEGAICCCATPKRGKNLFMRDETGALVAGPRYPGYPLSASSTVSRDTLTDSVERSGRSHLRPDQ